MARRRIERHKVDDVDGNIGRDVGREGSADGDLDRIADFEMTAARNGQGVGLYECTVSLFVAFSEAEERTGTRNEGEKSADSPASTPIQLPFAVTPFVPFLPSSSVVSATFLRVVCV